MPEPQAYNPRAPELTEQEADDVVDAFLHKMLEMVDETIGLQATLFLELEGQSRFVRKRVMRAFDRRREQYRLKAQRIQL